VSVVEGHDLGARLGVQSAADVLDGAERAVHAGSLFGAHVWPTGLSPLDTHLSGGIRAGELVLLGGTQGLGKTTFALQVARNIAAAGGHALYVCYEHDVELLLERLLTLEAGLVAPDSSLTISGIRRSLGAHDGVSGIGLAERLDAFDGGRKALESLRGYADRLHLFAARGDVTTLAHVRSAVDALRPLRPAVFLDYVQKVALDADVDDDTRLSRVATGAKDLALDANVPVFAVAALDGRGLETRRARTHHLRGATTLAYEADVILMLNNKFDVVARHHLVYDTARADRFRDWVVCTIEKNRNGEDHLDLEFRQRFAQSRYEAHGGMVVEELLDERLHRD